MASVIRFGTDGWRATIAEDYTFANVRIVSQAVAEYLKAEFARQGFPTRGPILRRSVFSGKLADTAAKAWEEANERRAVERRPRLQRITLQECRHTYASMLMAARYTSWCGPRRGVDRSLR